MNMAYANRVAPARAGNEGPSLPPGKQHEKVFDQSGNKDDTHSHYSRVDGARVCGAWVRGASVRDKHQWPRVNSKQVQTAAQSPMPVFPLTATEPQASPVFLLPSQDAQAGVVRLKERHGHSPGEFNYD